MIITLYVDDLILASNDLTLLKETKNNLSKKFEMVDLGEIQYCLWIHINCVQQDRIIYLNQIKYIKSILKQFGIIKSKLIQISFTTNCKLSKDMGFQNDIDL